MVFISSENLILFTFRKKEDGFSTDKKDMFYCEKNMIFSSDLCFQKSILFLKKIGLWMEGCS